MNKNLWVYVASLSFNVPTGVWGGGLSHYRNSANSTEREHTVNDTTFNLLIDVMNAAREGRYIHGNGRIYHINDYRGCTVSIDIMEGVATPEPRYIGIPRRDFNAADSIRSYLMLAEQEITQPLHYRWNDAHRMVAQAVQSDSLLYTNGGQWWIQQGASYVTCVNLAILADTAEVTHLNAHASWVYLQQQGTYRYKVSEETKRYMRF